eukprot:2696450-Prymnesium_polylepis.1
MPPPFASATSAREKQERYACGVLRDYGARHADGARVGTRNRHGGATRGRVRTNQASGPSAPCPSIRSPSI